MAETNAPAFFTVFSFTPAALAMALAVLGGFGTDGQFLPIRFSALSFPTGAPCTFFVISCRSPIAHVNFAGERLRLPMALGQIHLSALAHAAAR